MNLIDSLLAHVDQLVSLHKLAVHYRCDSCEENFGGEPFTSEVLPLSHFCSVDCRDAAEFAAEQVR